jgi:MFS family permease
MPSLALLTTVTSVVSSLGAPLVPAIAEADHVSLSTAQWSLTATLVMGAVSTPIVGRLGGNRRRRTVILVGLLVVTLGTLLSALPLGFGWLLTGRAMQGVGIGLTPLAIAVAREFVPAEKLSGAVALLSVTTVAGAGLGYPLTGWVAHSWGLAAAYWLGFGVCAATLALSLVTVPESPSTAADRVDWLGAAMLAGGTTGFLLAISQGDPWGWGSPRILVLTCGSILVMGLWVRRTLTSDHPLVDLRLARRHGAVAANVTALTAGVAVYMMLSIVMLGVQAPASTGFGLDQSVTTAGLLLVPYSVATMFGSRITIFLGRRMTPDYVLPIGCLLFLTATISLALWHYEVWQLLLVMAVAGLGGGTTFGAMPGLIMRFSPAEETASATAFNLVLRFLGFSTGSALALALLEVFSDKGQLVDASFTAVAFAAAGICAVSACLALTLAFVQARRGEDPEIVEPSQITPGLEVAPTAL